MSPSEYSQLNLPYAPFGEILSANLYPQFQISFNYNINSELLKSTVAGSGSITQSNSKAVVSTTANANSSALLESKQPVRYLAGTGSIVRFTGVFTAGKASSTQELGIGDANDALVIGFDGANFGINRRQNGVDNWTYQGDFNEDALNLNSPSRFNFDPTKGNIYQIAYQWLGFGEIRFYVEDPKIGKFIVFHRIKYANLNTNPTIYNPSLPMRIYARNNTNNTAITTQCASFGAFLTGLGNNDGLLHSLNNSKTGITTETSVLTMRNKTSYASKTNRTPVKLQYISLSTDGTKIVKFRLVKNTTLGGSPSYADLSTNTSVIDYDVAGTTLTGGTEILSVQLGKTDSRTIDLENYDIYLYPTETLTIGASSTSSVDAGVSIGFKELF